MALRKKTATKKAGKKKAGKKKAAKKKIKARVDHRLILQQPPDRPTLKARKHTPPTAPDTVRFTSKDFAYLITFTLPPPGEANPWPFVEAADVSPATIVVPAKGSSRKFTVDRTRGNGDYSYSVALAAGPKPEPQVDVEP